MLLKQRKNPQENKVSRILITINVLGNSGPLKLLVNEKEVVSKIIVIALRAYAREGRLPVLGSSDANDFLLYCANPVYDALCPSENIGQCRVRNFILCKNQNAQDANLEGQSRMMTNAKARCKPWLGKAISFKF
ncbi:hypothetical protein FRX31_016214 [Thalictrum thalictroides]|uniref:DUF7054 domain-containing protein n=1 Tax=Thalictrum thalictroides TaxID=46969 RepID=A0A7J6WC78_THATH|nr:hypothetical protein FRX31_016214 [Thalictrum thalictroides]